MTPRATAHAASAARSADLTSVPPQGARAGPGRSVALVLSRRPLLWPDPWLERGRVDVEPASPGVRFYRQPGEPVQALLPAGRVPCGPACLQLVGEHQAGPVAVRVELEPQDLVLAPGVGQQLRLVGRENRDSERHLDDLGRERERDRRADL